MFTTTAARAHSLIDALDLNLSLEAFDQIRGELRSAIDALATLPKIEGVVPQQEGGAHPGLSPREAEVMSMMLGGKRLKEIAAELEISVKTVTTHRARLLRKLHVSDNLGLFRYGVRNGLLAV